MALPPDQPTRPLPPVEPPAPVEPAAAAVAPRAPLVEQPAVVADDPVWRQLVVDRLNSLRTGLVVVALISLIASGLAAWALVRTHQDSQRAASREQVRALRERIRGLESDVRNAATARDVAVLGKRVNDVAGSAGADNKAREQLNEVTANVDALNDAAGDLDKRLKTLEQR